MNKNETHYIYTLNDGNNRIFYVGRTKNLKKRLNEHLEESKTGASRKCRRIRELVAAGHLITINQIDSAPRDKIEELEAWWINELDFNNGDFPYTVHLYNGNSGSQGNQLTDVEIRETVQEWKQKIKKKRAPSKLPANAKPVDPKSYERLSALWETDRAAFNRERAAHCELQRELEHSRKQHHEKFSHLA